jgi:hypothetical protein
MNDGSGKTNYLGTIDRGFTVFVHLFPFISTDNLEYTVCLVFLFVIGVFCISLVNCTSLCISFHSLFHFVSHAVISYVHGLMTLYFLCCQKNAANFTLTFCLYMERSSTQEFWIWC